MTKSLFVLVVALAVGTSAAAAQKPEFSANIGWVSEYIFRGIPQKTSSASGGLDMAAGMLSLGTWAADVGDGNEVDLYGSVAFEASGFSLSVGGTGYFYTGDFDNTYLEGNVGAGFGPVSVAFAYGTHDVDPSANYWWAGITATAKGFSFTLGHFDYDDDDASSGNYGTASYDASLGDLLDVSIAWWMSDEDLSGLGRVDHTLVLGLSKSFTIK